MKNLSVRTTATLLGLVCACMAYAQPSQPTATVPKLVRFSGSFHPANGMPAQPVESVTLSVYSDQTGGNALWQETQNVAVDGEGKYSALMGLTQNDGVPMELFASGEPRWLGAQFNRPGEPEQPRVLMTSVPYALKSVDAETLGGKPASAYLLAPSGTLASNAVSTTASGTTTAPATSTTVMTNTTAVRPRTISGTQNFLPYFTDASNDLGNSVVQQLNSGGNSYIGIGTVPGAGANTTPSLDLRTYPFSQIGMAQTVDYLGFFSSDIYGPAIYWNPGKDLRLGKAGAQLYGATGFVEQMRIQSATGNVGIGTMTPGSALDVVGDVNLSGNLRYQGSAFLAVPGGAANNNIALGVGALPTSSPGNFNMAIGASALLQNTGNGNTAIGYEALGNNIGGSDNIAIGFQAGPYSSGGNNIAIGYQAGIHAAPTTSNNIHIGTLGAAGDSATIRIGTFGVQSQFFVGGVNGVTLTDSNVPVLIDTTTGQLGTISSSRRYKEDIEDMGEASHGLMDLRPVTFRYKKPFADGSQPIQYGLIAEEVAEVYPDLVAHTADGSIETVKYQVLDSMLLNEVQRQQAEIRGLEQQNLSLQERLHQLEAKLETVLTSLAGTSRAASVPAVAAPVLP